MDERISAEEIAEIFKQVRSAQDALFASGELLAAVSQAAEILARALRDGKTIFLCGNGGSAADCQHIAGELVGRFKRERAGLPAVALTTDTSILTAIGNDYGFADVFRRQLEALGRPGDVLIAYSTSGNSENVLRALDEAARRKMRTIGLTGSGGGKMRGKAEVLICVPSSDTPRIQECHLIVGHALCELVEKALSGREEPNP